MGARSEGTESPLQTVGPGFLVGLIKPGPDDGSPDPGVFHDLALCDPALRDFPVERAAALDFFLAVAQLFCRVDCGQWRVNQKGRGSQADLPGCRSCLEHHQPAAVAGPSGDPCPVDGPSLLLDLDLPARPDAGADHLYHGRDVFFAGANVYYRDVAHIVQVVLSAWFYFTPIIYALDFIPANRQWLFKLNPIIYVINGFRLSIYYGQLPKWPSILASFVCAFSALLIGFAVFRKYQDDFVFYV